MILTRDESEVTVLGEVQKYKVSIDEKNLNHIVTILSSNLYSYPMQSFLREIVSNAVDSHLEAGVDEPIIITITDNDLSIRDFGTGISPERFQEIYVNIGSSTKRESNNYIGSFGIGRFSALSVSDIVNITSYYNGKAYYYVMNKDIDQLHIDLLFEKDTNEHNGVEVKIPFKGDITNEDWGTIAFIKNIYVEDSRASGYGEQVKISSAFNRRKVHIYKTFKLIRPGLDFSISGKYHKVLVGNIPYRVDYCSLWDDEHIDWKETFELVYPCLSIGDVDVTPNREGLLYSERTKDALRRAYNAAIEELKELWDKSCNTEVTDLIQYVETIYRHSKNIITLDSIDIPLADSLKFNIYYKDFNCIDIENIKNIIRNFIFYNPRVVIAKFDGYREVWQKSEKSLRYNIKELYSLCIREDYIMLIVPNATGFSSNYIKGFLKQRFGDKKVILMKKPYLSLNSIRQFIRQEFGITTISNSKEVHTIIKFIREFLVWFKEHTTVWDIIHSEEYIRYKEEHREKKTYVRNNTKMSFHIWYPGYSNALKEICSPYELIPHLTSKYKGCRIVYTQLDNIFIEAFRDINYPNLIIIGLSQSNYQLAEQGLFPSWVSPIEALYSEDNRHLQRMAALEYIRTKGSIRVFEKYVPLSVRKLSKELYTWSEKYPHGYGYSARDSYTLLNIVPKEKYDHEIMALYYQTEKYASISRKVLEENMTDLHWFYLMKARKVRLDYDYYKKTKENINYIMTLL